MKTKKVDAFTISELLVVLVISSIVISLTFIVLGLVQKQISQIQKGYQDQQEILVLKRILLKDMNLHQVFFNSKENRLSCINSLDTIQYHFKPDYIVRELDTFKLKIISKQLLLENRVVTSGWIDAMQLEFAQYFTAKKVFIYKVKDAAHYLNQ